MDVDTYMRYDATALADLVAKKEVTAGELLTCAINRSEAVNPQINAVVYPEYERAAQSIEAGVAPGPFAGVPFPLKNLYAYAKGYPLTNGSRILQNRRAEADDTYVTRCRAAGLVLISMTNSSEFGLNVSTEPAAYGPTRNPWNLAYSAGGSSGGAAAAVAAGIVPMAHATDGGGSIRIPASMCGLIGLKPSRARMPTGPVVGEAWNGLATQHVVCRSMRDAVRCLDATHGPEPGDPYACPAPERRFADEVGAHPGRLRIALMTESVYGIPVHPDCTTAVREAAQLLATLGHHVEEAAPKINAETLTWAHRVIISANLRATLDHLGRIRQQAVTPDEVEPQTWAFAEQGTQLRAADLASAITIVHMAGRACGRFMAQYDVLLSPTLAAPPPPIGHVDTGLPDEMFAERLMPYVAFTQLYNAIGWPAISLPLHMNETGLPIGVMFAARLGDEATLVRLASQIEQARPWFDQLPVFKIPGD
ncbi:amidase [Candidatus Entotheonella palauensis]|uniref:Amidase domain-containing protein n=1 Tax=Candidatus Entotheonella gemina TaxID=1429439 RepID=W4ME75_9BACT|nr:amidase [Candidatus Entotheonella palauensis]ETX08485.1 MAG: hypothetical protein ETSY2_05145 [Candidatus Entotheonella gemina]